LYQVSCSSKIATILFFTSIRQLYKKNPLAIEFYAKFSFVPFGAELSYIVPFL